MNQQTLNEPSRWQQRLRAMGPGIMMASAAVGGSHIIASTQAGALYGWQLALIIVLANLFKYPFFRFGPQYTLETGKSLLKLTWASFWRPGAPPIWSRRRTSAVCSWSRRTAS